MSPRSRAQDLGLGQHERQDCDPLLALRPVGAQVAVSGLEPQVVEVWPRARDATLEVGAEPRVELRHRRRLSRVLERRTLEPELSCERGERLGELAGGLATRLDQVDTDRHEPPVHGRNASRVDRRHEAAGAQRFAVRRASSTRAGGPPEPDGDARGRGRGTPGAWRAVPSRHRVGRA